MKKLLLILLMIPLGAALSLAFPRTSIWPIAWVGLVPLLIFTRDSNPLTAALGGLAFGIGFFGVLVYWVGVLGSAVWILLTLKEALPVALFGAFASIVYRSRNQWLVFIAVPALWTTVEWLRSFGALGFPWGYLAHSQAQDLSALQIANVTGVWGLTFVIALVNTALAARRGSVIKSLAIAGVVATLVHITGYWSIDRETSQKDKIAVAIVQTSVGERPDLNRKQRNDYTVRLYNRLTHEVVDYQPDLVVWPESAVPGDIVRNPEARKWISSIARASSAYMLVGGPLDVPAAGSRPATQKNGAHMLSPDGAILGSYYKVHLAPFGEFVPGRKWLSRLHYHRIRDVDLIAGNKHILLPAAFGKTGVMICFESVFPLIARKETNEGADFLCVITREALFKKTALALQHHDLSIFRAVENRRFVVRSAESGVSSIIDPYGRVQDKLGMWERGVLYDEIETRQNITIYTRFGDWFAYLCCGIAVFGVGSGIAQWQRKKAGNSKI